MATHSKTSASKKELLPYLSNGLTGLIASQTFSQLVVGQGVGANICLSYDGRFTIFWTGLT